MSSTLTSDAVASVLRRLHANADAEDHVAKQRVHDREAEIGRRLSAPEDTSSTEMPPLAISREVGELYYVLAMSRGARLTGRVRRVTRNIHGLLGGGDPRTVGGDR